MAFVLYEVWTEDAEGHQEFIVTTGSWSNAKEEALNAIREGAYQAIIYEDDERNDDVIEVERIKNC